MIILIILLAYIALGYFAVDKAFDLIEKHYGSSMPKAAVVVCVLFMFFIGPIVVVIGLVARLLERIKNQ